ncbi:hypothetical protein GGI03_004674, partial [Coemansia sp. RSA 2337]
MILLAVVGSKSRKKLITSLFGSASITDILRIKVVGVATLSQQLYFSAWPGGQLKELIWMSKSFLCALNSTSAKNAEARIDESALDMVKSIPVPFLATTETPRQQEKKIAKQQQEAMNTMTT